MNGEAKLTLWGNDLTIGQAVTVLGTVCADAVLRRDAKFMVKMAEAHAEAERLHCAAMGLFTSYLS